MRRGKQTVQSEGKNNCKSSTLSESGEQYRTLIENIPGAVYRCALDKHLTMEFISAAIQTISGFEAEDFVNNQVRSYASIIHPDDVHMVGKKIIGAVEAMEPFALHYRIINSQGEIKWVYEKGKAIYGQDNVPRWIDGLIVDHTDQYKALRNLKTEHAQLLSIFDSMDEAIYVADPQSYNLLYVNGVFRRNWGKDVGQKCYRALQGRDTPCPFCTNDMIFGENLGNTHIWEFQNSKNNRWYRCIDRAIEWTEGKMVRFEMAIDNHNLKMAQIELDNHRKQLEKLVEERTVELTAVKEEAEQANKAKSIFLANMSHELRSPLNVIMGYSQLIQKETLSPTEHRKYLNAINRNSERLLALINDVLELSKIEAGRLTLENTTFDLRAMLRDLEREFESGISARGLSFKLAGINDVPRYVYTDQIKLWQVMVHMVGNAVKFTEHGGVTVQVASKKEKTGAIRLAVEVQDTGIGISKEELEKVFCYLDQAVGGRAQKSGSGLGLAISRDYVRKMGGDISVTSKEGGGSTFRFEIGIQKGRKKELDTRVSRRRVMGLQPGQKPPRVLVAEDKSDSRVLLVKILESTGFQVKEAVNGKEAVEMFHQWRPDFIWMDLRMPVLGGFEAIQRIKKSEAGQSAIVAALSAHALAEEKEQVLAAGCDDFVYKPFREQEIFEVMAKHLNLQYVYEGEPVDHDETLDAKVQITPQQLAALPADMLNRLHHAVVELDKERVLMLVEEIKPIDAHTARSLDTCVKRFALSQLLELLENVKKAEPEGSDEFQK